MFVVKVVTLSSGIGGSFKKHKDTLAYIQKQLEQYMEKKREAFPRFYFLSNDELLEILANSKDLAQVNKHIKKCFENINKLDFGDDPKSIMVEKMISGESEIVPFRTHINTNVEIESWLKIVQD